MVRSTKADKTTTAAATVAPVAPVVETAPAVALKEKKEKVVKEKKTKDTTAAAPVAAAPAPAPVSAAPAPVSAAPAVAVPEAPVSIEVTSEAKLAELETKLQQVSAVLISLKGDIKTIRKIAASEKKVYEKASKGKGAKRSSGNRKPSGFIKPARISDELAVFLGRAVGTEMARTEVSKEISKYIDANNLKNKTNGRIIHPDAKLTALLKIANGEELNYFNLQKYMKHHFVKATPAATA